MKQLWRMTVTEFKLVLREPIVVFFALAFPVLLVVVFGVIFGNEAFAGTDMGFVDIAVPGYIALVIATAALMSLPIPLATYREQGILRRFRATPANPAAIVAAQINVSLVLTTIGVILLFVVGRLLFGLQMPSNLLALAPAFLLASLSFFALGMVLASIAPSSRAAQGIGMAIFFPMLFLSGAALPRTLMPEAVQRAAEFLPLTHVVTILTDLWHGAGWNVTSVLVLVALLIVATGVSVKTFRWE